MSLRLVFLNAPDRRPTPAKKTPPVRVSSTHHVSQEMTSMSHRTSRDQTSPRRGVRRIATVALAVTAVWLVAACHPVTGQGTDPATVDTPVDVTRDVEFSTSCDDTGFAFDIEPNTPEAREAAQRACRRIHDAVESADWPEGLKPTGPVVVER
ncbi:hypothetical protein F4560_006806 [Saccharothrix ecbatanensis]|uniref:Uncharacterized protein n=1 Tax=Saccharothrix ecbatanensis TaxID=1105145 RepID=A0A7W9HS52_9PSEU|nr:hypothetical protein [Saccharothrix ecbatanensis]MBB5807038.1 hypothetical protein [Saccharothrix ecbatanensis]